VGLFKLREKITSKVAAQSRAASTYSSDLILGFNGVVLAWVFALAVNTSVDQTIQNFTDVYSANSADDTSKVQHYPAFSFFPAPLPRPVSPPPVLCMYFFRSL